MFEGRRELMAESGRITIYHPSEGEIQCHLKDWFLPALYQQAKDSAPFAKAVLEPGGKVCRLPLFGDFPETRFKFTGRSKELWELERFLRKKRAVILHGFGGQGKTAIACEASRWLTRTGMFDRALFVSFEEGGDAEGAVLQMGQVLQDEFSKLSRKEQMPALKKALSGGHSLVVWDNFESLLPKGNAELPGDELRKLLDMGLALTEDSTAKLLITTRDRDLRHQSFEASKITAHMGIEGFRLSESLEFAGNILDDLGHSRPDRPDLERLLEYLGGHPLSIQLVVPKLKDFNNNVKQVIDEFENLYPDFKSGKAKHRNESLDVSLSFSLNRLSEETKKQMSGLGVFEGRAVGFAIGYVCEIEKWDETGEKLMGELEGVGLVKKKNLSVPAGFLRSMYSKEDIPQEMFEKTVLMPFYKFHSTLAPYLRARQTPEERKALEERYRKFYYVFSSKLYFGDRRAPHEIRIIAKKEMPNLRHALDITMKAGETDTAVEFADNVERFLNYFGRWRERDTMMKKMESFAGTSASDGPLTKTEFLMQSRRGEGLWQKGRAKEAEQIFRGLLARMDAGMDYDGTYDRALTLFRLGRCLKSQGRAVEAETEYRRALDVLAGMDQNDKGVRRQTGVVHTDLADTLRNQGHYSEAKEQYEAALKIDESLGDKRGAAVDLGQLGTLAMLQRDYEEAKQRYKEALNHFKALGETQMESVAWHQLAMVAEEEAERTTGDQRTALLTEAEKAYKGSLRLEEFLGNKTGAAETANQLAMVSENAGRFADAERWYKRAMENFKAAGHQLYVAVSCNNLADLLLNVHKISKNGRPPAFANRDLLSEAEQWAHQARKIMESIGDLSVQIWNTYNILAQIAEAVNNPEAVIRWRKKERKAYAAFPGHWARHQKTWIPQIAAIRKAVQGDSEAKEAVASLLDKLAQTDDWKNLAVVLGKVLSGERDAEKLADEYKLDGTDYLILVKVLEGLSEPQITTD
ncbi:MAG: tetratricopeptide repeat protein [Desulfobacterales bacterium]|nr:tetratricopeptide repeat protein [Desulfobacterales bacterium]